jgi:serine protease Do
MALMAAWIYLPTHEQARADNHVTIPRGEWQDTIADVAERVLPAVVAIEGVKSVEESGGGFPDLFRGLPLPPFFEREPQAPREVERPFLGSGWIYAEDGYIVTNAHIALDAKDIKVRLHDTDSTQTVDAAVVGYDLRSDLAVLKVKVNRKLPTLPLGDSEAVRVGEWVLALGSPFMAELEQTVTAGIISAKGREVPAFVQQTRAMAGDVLQTDAAINPGNSGGPLVNLNGEVVGINESIISPGRGAGGSGFNVGIGFAISAKTAQEVIPQLIADGEVTRGWIGVGLRDNLSQNMRDLLDLTNGGVLVTEVHDGGPADQGGVQVNDVITEINGTKIDEYQDVVGIVGPAGPGKKLALTVLRDGKPVQLEVTTTKMPDKYNGGAIDEPEPTPAATDIDPLGLRVSPLTSGSALSERVGTAEGVRVVDVDPSGPAATELQPNDVITHINLIPVKDVASYESALESVRSQGKDYAIVRAKRVLQDEVVTALVEISPEW